LEISKAISIKFGTMIEKTVFFTMKSQKNKVVIIFKMAAAVPKIFIFANIKVWKRLDNFEHVQHSSGLTPTLLIQGVFKADHS
jgi:hypothetical protein